MKKAKEGDPSFQTLLREETGSVQLVSESELIFQKDWLWHVVTQKKVTKVEFKGKPYVYKVFLSSDKTGSREVNIPFEEQVKSAVTELTAYRYFAQTKLGSFLPRCLDLLVFSGEAVGLLVEWKEHVLLSCFREYVSQQSFELLEEALISIDDSGKLIEPDCFSESNIMVEDSSRQLFLAECYFIERAELLLSYEEYVRREMEYLKKNYAY